MWGMRILKETGQRRMVAGDSSRDAGRMGLADLLPPAQPGPEILVEVGRERPVAFNMQQHEELPIDIGCTFLVNLVLCRIIADELGFGGLCTRIDRAALHEIIGERRLV